MVGNSCDADRVAVRANDVREKFATVVKPCVSANLHWALRCTRTLDNPLYTTNLSRSSSDQLGDFYSALEFAVSLAKVVRRATFSDAVQGVAHKPSVHS